jgi:hypothetical protein
MEKYCERLWIAPLGRGARAIVDKIPDHVGVVYSTKGGIKIYRPATSPSKPARTGPLAEAVLSRIIAVRPSSVSA